MKEDTLNKCSNHFSETSGTRQRMAYQFRKPGFNSSACQMHWCLEANKCFAILLKIEFQCITCPINPLPQWVCVTCSGFFMTKNFSSLLKKYKFIYLGSYIIMEELQKYICFLILNIRQFMNSFLFLLSN